MYVLLLAPSFNCQYKQQSIGVGGGGGEGDVNRTWVLERYGVVELERGGRLITSSP